MLMQDKMEFIKFYKDMLDHDDFKIKMLGIFYLPCMHLLFKDVQEECEFDFA
jgi:hypothetical protein